ncbi:Uncharacterised protein [Dermatophilus congolensis]|uniref:Uncharacterized protein n=1 Tax=Dermatophilus congolensis TaxID=1863 RepID=A0AA46BPK1_9MICO|nr:Uncharacterised protein [Dermatophilus congolensis]STD15229.1 Uncharacterised protein [Dermatophilus congolensis]
MLAVDGVAFAQPEADVDESDEGRDLDQGADDAGEGLAGGDTEGGDGDGDGEFEVVAGGGEGEGGGAFVAQVQTPSEQVADAPYDREVDQERQGDADDVEGAAGDLFALQGEQHDDGEQKPVQRPGADLRQEAVLVGFAAPGVLAQGAGQVSGDQRDAEEDQDALGDLPGGDVQAGLLEAEPGGQGGQVEPAERGEGDDLEDRVDRDEHGGRFAVTAGQVVPDDDHGDAAREPDDDQAGAVGGQVGEEGPCQREHHQGTDDPVQQQAGDQHAPVVGDGPEPVVSDLGEHRVHHHEQPDADGQRDAVHLDGGQRRADAGDDTAQQEPDDHGREDPHGQVAIERGQLLRHGRPGRCGRWFGGDYGHDYLTLTIIDMDVLII